MIVEEEVAEAVLETVAEFDLPAELAIAGLVLAITDLAESQVGSGRDAVIQAAIDQLTVS